MDRIEDDHSIELGDRVESGQKSQSIIKFESVHHFGNKS